MCYPGTLGFPSLSPASTVLQVGSLSLSWSIAWNDHCSESHTTVVSIWNGALKMFVGYFNDVNTSISFSEDELELLGFTDATYKWGVAAIKGSQTRNTNSSFTYCIPVGENLELQTPGENSFE